MAKKNSQRAWTVKEINILKKYYPEKGWPYVANILKRSKMSVISRAVRLELISNYRYRSGSKNSCFKGCGEISGTYWSSVKHNASVRNIEFNLTIEYAWTLYKQQGGLCKLSGIPIFFKEKTASLDRIDSTKGYIKGNVQWIHKNVNQMKWHFDQSKFIHYCRQIANYAIPKVLPNLT